MNNIALGQYIDRKSLIHKLDPRTKIIALILLMVATFLIPEPVIGDSLPIYYPFIAIGVLFSIIIVVVILSKISVFKYLKSIKQIFFLLIFSFIINLLSNKEGNVILTLNFNFSFINIGITILLFVLFIVFRKYIPIKVVVLALLFVLSIYILGIDFGFTFNSFTKDIYSQGLYSASFICLKIFIAILLSTILTLTTKPTDLTNGLEWLLHPLTWIKINVSIFAMMISLALRFIPTLFNETNKILKAQSSRGVDFKEGKFFEQIAQIISLLIPMFVISYKRAEDLADAMEARGYIPGEKRTKINVLKFKFFDYFGILVSNAILALIIVWRVLK